MMRDVFAMCLGAFLVLAGIFVILDNAEKAALYGGLTVAVFFFWLALYLHDKREAK